MRKKNIPKYFILDVDGVITNGQMIYDKNGKKYKIFGQDDHDSLKIIKKYMNIFFISGDKIGFKISNKRTSWLQNTFGLENCIYMGDGIFDHLVMKKVLYSIAPNGCLDHVSKTANFKTKNYPGNRAVAEAVIHILKHFFGIDFVKLREFNI